MIQLLIISENPAMPDSIRAILAAPERVECHYKRDVETALHLLERPLFDACLLDTDLTTIRPIRAIEAIRKANPKIPILVVAGELTAEWEEEAALMGADFILRKPIRGTLFNNLFSKLVTGGAKPNSPTASGSASLPSKAGLGRPGPPPPNSLQTLEILRDFSRIFSFSLNLKSFAYQFALKLREITGVNRIAIFLEKPPPSFLGSTSVNRSHRLQCLCSVGIETELFEYLTLSTRSGIGQTVLRSGRILRHNDDSGSSLVPPDFEVEREFNLLGCQIAIPILDRERAIGVAALGDRLTGEAFSNEELELLFHLMEELGMAIKSNLLHDHLLANHKLISSVFARLNSGCLVVDEELNILHANPALLRFLKLSPPVQLSSLPRKLASLLYESAHGGKSHEPFLFSPPESGESFRVSIFPFQEENGVAGAMMSVEDFTPIEAARKAEVQASNFRLTALIAERFAHEIRNALVPIETCRQLIPENRADPEFNKTLATTLQHETRRISRLADQLLYLSKQDLALVESRTLEQLLREAFDQAKPLIQGDPKLVCEKLPPDCRVQCDSASLKHAFFELLLNGFQANADEPRVTVSAAVTPGSNGNGMLTLTFRDQGGGIPPDFSEKAAEPFFTTRNVGVGLGLSVTKKIIERHEGKLEIRNRGTDGQGSISISLPVNLHAN